MTQGIQGQGLLCLAAQELGGDIEVVCSWNPMEVWYGLPNTSSEFNDTLTLENYGDEDSALQNAGVNRVGCRQLISS